MTMTEVVPMRREPKLNIAAGLSLPLDAVTQTFLIVGKRGSGKSNTAARFVEQLHHARLPFVVLDPVDTWWGLKAGREGGRGLDVYVFGGRKADLPLEPGGGALLAEVLCEHRLSMVLSVKHLSGRERSTFMVAFAQTLFQKWAGGPLHVVLEEAHELAPQSAQNAKDGEQLMLGAFKRLWKLGRASGIGGTAITQRPASLSKDITTQSEILIAHRTIGPQDVKAVGEWVKYHGESQDILAELPTLPTGQAFVWAPEFPEGRPLGLQRTTVMLRDTYDSASTPKVGEQRVEPKELAPVDLERLRVKMAATIEKAKADDPKELRKQIADLQRQVAAGQKAAQAPVTNEGPLLTGADRQQLAELAGAFRALNLPNTRESEFLEAVSSNVTSAIDQALAAWRADVQVRRREFEEVLQRSDLRTIAHAIAAIVPTQPRQEVAPRTALKGGDHGPRPSMRVGRPASSGNASGDPRISGPQQVLLDSLAWLASVHIAPARRGQLALVAKVSSNSSGFEKNLSTLRTAGLVEYPGQNLVALTDAGCARAAAPEMVPTIEEMQASLYQRVSGPQAALLKALVAAYPHAMSRERLAAEADPPVSPTSSGFEKNCSTLRSLGLAEYPDRGSVRAAPVLFLEA